MSILLAPELLFLSLISFYSCCVESFDSNTTGAGVTSLDKLCPYTNYCTKNKTNSRDNVEEVPCCRNCFCGNNCWKRGDCCSDKENKTVKQPLESCEIVVVKHSPYYHPTQFGGNFFQRYFVIKSCPRKDDPLADKCSGNLQSYLEDYVWVTDKTTNDIYNNKHCAICNEVRNYSPWQVRTDCTEAMNGHNSPEAAVNYILKECEIIVGPPSMESHSDDICMVPDITQCNVTGQWESHDLALETACNNFNQIYLEEKAWTTVAYRNVCCFLCNSPRGQHVPDICPNGAARPKFSNNGFSGILDYRAFERVKETAANDVLGSDLVCAIDEIEDPVQVFSFNILFNIVQ